MYANRYNGIKILINAEHSKGYQLTQPIYTQKWQIFDVSYFNETKQH